MVLQLIFFQSTNERKNAGRRQDRRFMNAFSLFPSHLLSQCKRQSLFLSSSQISWRIFKSSLLSYIFINKKLYNSHWKRNDSLLLTKTHNHSVGNSLVKGVIVKLKLHKRCIQHSTIMIWKQDHLISILFLLIQLKKGTTFFLIPQNLKPFSK